MSDDAIEIAATTMAARAGAEREEEETDVERGCHESKQSPVAKELSRLRSTATTLMASRGKLPQPLFWSLFHSQIEEIKKKKRLERLLDSVLGRLS